MRSTSGRTPARSTSRRLLRSMDGVEIVGQPRAVESVRFAVGMQHDGYNLFALGPPGTGRQFIVEHFLNEQAAGREIPSDLCYVNNFEETNKPKLLQLPPGTALKLKADMKRIGRRNPDDAPCRLRKRGIPGPFAFHSAGFQGTARKKPSRNFRNVPSRKGLRCFKHRQVLSSRPLRMMR